MCLNLVLDCFDLICCSDCQLKAIFLDIVVDFGPTNNLQQAKKKTQYGCKLFTKHIAKQIRCRVRGLLVLAENL